MVFELSDGGNRGYRHHDFDIDVLWLCTFAVAVSGAQAFVVVHLGQLYGADSNADHQPLSTNGQHEPAQHLGGHHTTTTDQSRYHHRLQTVF